MVNPCTNVPVQCMEGSCQRLGSQFWRYNVAAHYQQAHPSLDATAIIAEAMSEVISDAGDYSARKERVLAIAARLPPTASNVRTVIEGIAGEREQGIQLCGTVLISSRALHGPALASSAVPASAPASVSMSMPMSELGSSSHAPMEMDPLPAASAAPVAGPSEGVTPITCKALGKRRAVSSPPRGA